MSSIIANLKSIKDKVSNLKELSILSEPNLFDSRKSRVEMKTIEFFKNSKNTVLLNIGGEKIIPSNLVLYLNFKHNLTILNKLNSYDKTKKDPVFIDITLDAWETLSQIIRINPDKLNKTTKLDEKISVYTATEIPILEVYAANLFGSDWDYLKKRFEFVYLTINRRLTFLSKNNDVEAESQLWGSDVKIKCYICGKLNDGNFWKQKYSSKKREDDYVIRGYYATCITCDATKTKKF